MNAQEQLDYVFGLLEGPRRGQAERELAEDPALADRVARLARAVDGLVNDGEDYEPPADLARRTLQFVESHRRQPRPRRTILDFVPVRVPFRWADVAVAAGILVAGLATLVPAVRQSRSTAEQLGCALNLEELGTAMHQYAGATGTYPYVAPAAEGDAGTAPYAGIFAILLKDRGYLHSSKPLHCPCCTRDGHVPDPLPDYRQVVAADRQSPRSSPCLHNLDYAYNLGYQHDGGRPGPIPAQAPDSIPLLADQPPFADTVEILPGNSPNHHGAGQNVLYTGGHVRFHPTRRLGPGDEDMFLNAHRRPAPGVHMFDAVLAPGVGRFDGK